MFCPSCGGNNIEGARFCTHCGMKMTSAASAPPAASSASGTLSTGTLSTGTLLDGRYVIESLVSSGGFGKVYRAKDTRFSSEVALKEMTGQAGSDEEQSVFQRYFRQEAQVLRSLKHPSLPRVIDYFSEQDRFFLVMDFIMGESLRSLIEGRAGNPVPEEEVLEWFFLLLDIMEYLHGQEPPIIHRDIKPDNLIWQAGRKALYLVDFGIVRVGCATKTLSYGTPGYAPPEQAQGLAHPSMDIYSAGATLHHLLSGVDPAGHPFDFEPLGTVRRDIQRAFADTVDRMVALKAKERFQSVGEIREFFDRESSSGSFSQQAKAAPAGVLPAAMSQPPAPDASSALPPAAVIPSPRPAPAERQAVSPAPQPPAAPLMPSIAASIPSATQPQQEKKAPVACIREPGESPAKAPERPRGKDSPAVVPEGLTFTGINAQGFELYQNLRDRAPMIWIPQGEALLGAHHDDREGRPEERPLHMAVLSPYWAYEQPVTNRQFARFVSLTGYEPEGEWEEYWEKSGDEYPVVQVSWNDARAYCGWARAELPTEAQWERGARGTDERVYPWGSFFDVCRLNCWDSPKAPWKAHFFEEKGPSPPGAYPGGASPWGCLDMAGNVWEWCLDSFNEGFYKAAPRVNPFHESPKTPYKVAKGGAWNELPRNCRIARRLKVEAVSAAKERGFRAVMNYAT
ncbi:MAG: SUMF1/EgtB/PvdO family nonheme iron enzyme [Candidatus Eremiobacteraeota bacterium]|nr:SUMF1/EgtB/PvdO family nonheme iron enzyme [Candidatus Eremiobacteraeota bacterium]